MDSSFTVIASILPWWLWPLLQFLIGLGLVVFVHELGHFLVAKWAGIKVERFAIGFGPNVIALQRGETEYCFKAIPLGGYIKMLGQEDFRPLDENEQINPRAYNAKPVGVRLAVVSAGVVMNVIFGAILFVVVALHGKDFPAPIVGSVREHFPAATAKITWDQPAGAASTQPATSVGLQPGDEIVRIDGRGVVPWMMGSEVTRFQHMELLSTLADRDDQYSFAIRRQTPAGPQLGHATLGVMMSPATTNGGKRLAFGIGPSPAATVERDESVLDANYLPYRDGDQIKAIGGKAITQGWEVQPAVAEQTGSRVAVTVRRGNSEVTLDAPRFIQYAPHVVSAAGKKIDIRDYTVQEDDGKLVLNPVAGGQKLTIKPQELQYKQAAVIMDLLGMVPRFQIAGIHKDSEASRKGLQAGDVIVSYADRLCPTHEQVQEINKAAADKGTEIVVERGGKVLPAIKVVPEKKKDQALLGIVPCLEESTTIVGSVRPGSWADKAGIQRGSVIQKINGAAVASWVDVFTALKGGEGKEVTVTYRKNGGESDTSEAKIETLDKGVFDPADYTATLFVGATNLGIKMVTIRKEGVLDALAWGVRETGVFIVTTYATLKSLATRTVSGKDLIGPIGMGGIAIAAAQRGFIEFVYFMAIISASIAVLNFLPLPVVDGGHAVFLLIEKVRGKPIPVKVLNIVQMVGLVLLLGVFVIISFQDIMRLF